VDGLFGENKDEGSFECWWLSWESLGCRYTRVSAVVVMFVCNRFLVICENARREIAQYKYMNFLTFRNEKRNALSIYAMVHRLYYRVFLLRSIARLPKFLKRKHGIPQNRSISIPNADHDFAIYSSTSTIKNVKLSYRW